MADQGCVWLYGCRQKFVSAGLDCGLGCTPPQSVTHSAATAAVSGLVHYISVRPLPFLCAKTSYLEKNVVDWRLDLETQRVAGVFLVQNELVVDAEERHR